MKKVSLVLVAMVVLSFAFANMGKCDAKTSATMMKKGVCVTTNACVTANTCCDKACMDKCAKDKKACAKCCKDMKKDKKCDMKAIKECCPTANVKVKAKK